MEDAPEIPLSERWTQVNWYAAITELVVYAVATAIGLAVGLRVLQLHTFFSGAAAVFLIDLAIVACAILTAQLGYWKRTNPLTEIALSMLVMWVSLAMVSFPKEPFKIVGAAAVTKVTSLVLTLALVSAVRSAIGAGN
jgi:hypothetical protein